MPNLEILESDGSLSPLSFLTLLSVMLFPKDEEARHSFIVLSFQDIRNQFRVNLERETGSEEEINGGEKYLLSKAPNADLARYPKKPQAIIDRLIKNRRWQGLAAGEMLSWIVYMNHFEQSPSVNKAHCVESKKLEQDWAELKNLFEESPLSSPGGSPRWLWKAWGEFKPVSHLWAAYKQWQLSNGIGKDGILTSTPSFLQNEHILEFLGLAESFLKIGTSIKPTRSIKPILNREEAWTTPEQLALPEIPLVPSRDEYLDEIIKECSPRSR